MLDSDEEDDLSVNLTSFLFGNIDKDGELADTDTFEADTVSKLKGLGSILQQTELKDIIREVKSEAVADQVQEDVTEKADDAEDFSNISEVISDSEGEEETSVQTNRTESKESTQRDSGGFPPDDSMLMPPPAKPKDKDQKSNIQYFAPLANMLPEKYKDCSVKDFYPEFRENSVLRFSKLFPIKDSHKPRTWKSLKKRRIKREDRGEEEPAVKKKRGWVLNIAPPPEDPDAYEVDDQVKFMKPMQIVKPVQETPVKEEDVTKKGPKENDWRWGPAQYWYDMVEVPSDVEEYDYGIKAQGDEKDESLSQNGEDANIADEKKAATDSLINGTADKALDLKTSQQIEYPPDAFHMVTQVTWEEDIIWNGEEIKHKVLSKLNAKANAAGWVPSSLNRTAVSFSQQRPGVKPELQIRLATLGKKLPEREDDKWYSIFPVENEELVYGRWEDEVIWDSAHMPTKLHPNIVSLDPNDENIIIAIPEDIDPDTLPNEEPARKIKIIQKHVKKSKLLLNRAGIISVVEEESPPPPPKNDDRDPFYIGNDEFYQAKEPASLIKVATGGTLLQHATPAVQLTAPFIPTHMGPIKLRQFHRWPLKRYSHGPLSHYLAFHGVQSLYKHQRKMEKWRTTEREEAGGGDIFLMRESKDVSGKDGDIILFEYIEEYPPLVSFVGMSSKIKNYYKKKPENDKAGPKELKYGALTYAHTSPFLGTMTPGQTIQAIENNMYRCPIYQHNLPKTDFLIIRTRNEFSIREVNAFYVAGQQCPLYEVPGPNSKRANNFIRDFLQVFIYRLFWRSRDNPKRIKMDDIKKAFPAHSESSIRKRLKPCAEFHRTGPDSNWWVMKPGFRLPTEEEIREMVDPESCCAFYSMTAAEQRLKDAGYGDKFILAQEDDENDNTEMKMDDEIKCAPWMTSRAYVQAMKGKCLLQLTGPADPTGPAKEGFSYVKIPNKPTNKEEQEAQPKRTVTGTDADLRKLPLKDAKAILRKNGVPEEEIKKLSRWEVIDVVRTLSTEKVKAGEEGVDSFKFSRGNRFSIAEHQERYREDCQRIFEVQNKVLASDEVLSSDEDVTSSEEEEEEDDLDEMGKNIENMLSNKKTSKQYMTEREEMERRKLQKVMMENRMEEKKKKKEDGDDRQDEMNPGASQVLRITRTFKNAQGKEYTRTELVRKPLVIETYVKVRNTKDETFIRQFATMDEQVKEEMKKEKRRIQEQLRRLKRNQEREKQGLNKVVKKKEKVKPDLKLKCGACGQTGHMRTNKTCPKFTGEMEGSGFNVNVSGEMEDSAAQRRLLEENLLGSDDLVTAEGTKIKISEKVLKHAEEMRRRDMQLKTPKDLQKANKRKRAGTGKHCDYLDKREYGPVKRRRIDPVISFSSFLETLLNELRGMQESQAFLYPVPPKTVPDYYEKIKFPMDLQTIRENVQNKKYHSREEILADVKQIYENSILYNGETSIITINSKVVLDRVIQRFQESDDYLMRLEKLINPLLDDDDLTALTYILSEIMEKNIKTMQESWPFMKPVNKKAVKDYYEIVKQPMDLETMTNKIKTRKYYSREAFLYDMELIFTNSRTFNGPTNEYTLKAKKLLDSVKGYLAQYEDHCTHLEKKIKETQQRALEQAEMDSLGTSLGGDTEEGETKKRRKKKKSFPSGLPEDESTSDDDDDDWDEVDDSQPGPSGFSVTVDPANQNTGLPGNIVVKTDPGLLNDDFTVKSEPVDVADYYSSQLQGGPVFNIQTGQDGQFYAEQSQQFFSGDQNIVGFQQQQGMVANLQQLQGLQTLGGFPGFQMEFQPPEDQQVDENYDPTDFLQGLGAGQDLNGVVVPSVPQNGDQNLQDDLAVSDDSDDEKPGLGAQDDPMAF